MNNNKCPDCGLENDHTPDCRNGTSFKIVSWPVDKSAPGKEISPEEKFKEDEDRSIPPPSPLHEGEETTENINKPEPEVDYGAKAKERINKRLFINQNFRLGEYCKETEFKRHERGFMHVTYRLFGTENKASFELFGFGEIYGGMLWIHSFYGSARGLPVGYNIIPMTECIVTVVPYMDFVNLCAGLEEQMDSYDEEKATELEYEKNRLAYLGELEKKRIELLGKRADEMEEEVNYMKSHPTAAWLKHIVNKWGYKRSRQKAKGKSEKEAEGADGK